MESPPNLACCFLRQEVDLGQERLLAALLEIGDTNEWTPST
jgi:hypothetical protein